MHIMCANFATQGCLPDFTRPAAGQPAGQPDLDFSNLDSIQEDLQKMHAKMGGDLTSLQELKRNSFRLAK